ncbi:MAG: hypothetical protein Q9195_009267 [Heterodermia aff. obscurata]
MEKRTGPKATPSDGAFTKVSSKSAHATEQEQLTQEKTLKRRRATLLGTSPFEELSGAPVLEPVLSTPKFEAVSTPKLEAVSTPKLEAVSAPNLEADVSVPSFKSEYNSPYALPGAQDLDVKVEGQETHKKLTRVSQACDMCHDRKTKASIPERSILC